MDVNIIQTIISELGFPFAVCVGSAFFIWKMYQVQVADKEKLYIELAQNREERKSFIEVLNKFNARFEVLEVKVDSISEKLDTK